MWSWQWSVSKHTLINHGYICILFAISFAYLYDFFLSKFISFWLSYAKHGLEVTSLSFSSTFWARLLFHQTFVEILKKVNIIEFPQRYTPTSVISTLKCFANICNNTYSMSIGSTYRLVNTFVTVFRANAVSSFASGSITTYLSVTLDVYNTG